MKASPSTATTGGLSRRTFLQSTALGGLMLGLQLPLAGRVRAAAEFAPNAFVRIAPDDTVTLIIKHFEMGQGSTTGLVTLLAEELDADIERVAIEYAPANAQLYGNALLGGAQGTGGSSAMADSWTKMRRAGATARAMLVQAAAQRWRVPAAEIAVSRGVVSAGNRRATFGELAAAAAEVPVPETVSLKAPGDFIYIGRESTRRVDSRAKSTGTATFTIDVRLPELLTAVIAWPPAFGATLKSYKADKALQVKGVVDVVEIPEGVAVVAEGMWPAIKGRRALELDWDTARAGPASSEALYAEYEALADQPGQAVVASDDTAPRLAKAARKVTATYHFPYLAHAAMEPMNCVAWLHDGRLETWSGHQFPSIDHPSAARAAGLETSQVTLHTLVSGGSFGRRANPWADFTVAAVQVAKALKDKHGWERPVRMQMTREDDTRAGQYRPLYVHKAEIGLDANGALSAWRHAIVGQSIMAGAGMLRDGQVDESSVEGVEPTPYSIPAHSVALHSPAQPVRPLWWRSVGHTHTAFAVETLMDELAEAAGKDPVAFRLALLDGDPRMAGVLKRVAEEGNWGRELPEGRAQGIAVHYSFRSYVAQLVEVSLRADGLPRVHKVHCAVDCGVAINPDQVAAQMEGGIGFALAGALYGEIDIEQGEAKQSNFHDYRVLRIDEMPEVAVHIVDSRLDPTGVGEPGVPPLAPAVANAMYRLSGKRVRRLPFAAA
ncbi:xanthine dehydrogenase family protein molybdopterin-binding subunit [Parahaliea mediterranea]|uniref:Xanthine dehydrogenase family protein molybdopterin-binding subunit n=1 Tax=Parahaliea mediterranea TaxID=651086 RepID=A0A939IIH0_9GAMM|nr:xanthine dehydrogenase family protein molybdopterin-binding subunit [Parahaliea mediterranea]MBN7796604.1 xanthine dehydrogenase family protein molybdopterin-binding subunit [Parahaliea mediterranea]